MSERIFNEMEDFYCSLMKDEETSSLFSDFMRAYEGSLGGCKCTSGSRRRYAENLYVNIDETFTQEIRYPAKSLHRNDVSLRS